MKLKTVFILILTLVCERVHAQKDVLWYKVTAGDNDIWDKESNISITKTNGDSVLISGFSDQGATLKGIIRDGRITIPRQTATIIPYGGDGKLQWDIVAEAEGTITNGSLIELQYYFAKDTFETRGNISAVRFVEGVLHTRPPKQKKK